MSLTQLRLILKKNFMVFIQIKCYIIWLIDGLKSSIKRQYNILAPDGIICHSFWKGDGSEIFKGLFVNYHNENIIREFFSGYFEILLLESYQEFEEDDSLLLVGRKK